MLVQLFRDSLNEYAYAAELAGLKWELINTKYGLIVSRFYLFFLFRQATIFFVNISARNWRLQQQATHPVRENHGETNQLQNRPQKVQYM